MKRGRSFLGEEKEVGGDACYGFIAMVGVVMAALRGLELGGWKVAGSAVSGVRAEEGVGFLS